MRRTGLSTAVFAASLLASASASAQTETPQTDADPEPVTAPADRTATPSPGASSREQAVVRYERGRALYAAGRYREAVVELERAYTLDPAGTNLLLNLGMVLERLGHIDDATVAYTRHLATATDEAERARTQRILTRLRGARAELADIARRRGRADGLFWGVAGGAIAGTAIGVAMFATQRPGASDATAPLIFTVTGASLGVLATVLYFAREAPERQTLFVHAAFAPGAATLGVAGSF